MAVVNGTIEVNKLDVVRDAFKAVTSSSLHFMLEDEKTLKILSTGNIIDTTKYRFYIVDAPMRSATPYVFSPNEILCLAYKHREGGYREFEGTLAGFEDLQRKVCSDRDFVIFRKIGGLLRQIV